MTNLRICAWGRIGGRDRCCERGARIDQTEMLRLEDEFRPAERLPVRRKIVGPRQGEKGARRFDAAELGEDAASERHGACAERRGAAQTGIMNAMPDQESVVSPVDEIRAGAAHIARMIGDEVHEGRAEVRRRGQELSDDPQMVETSRRAENQAEVVAARRLRAFQHEVRDDGKRQATVDVRERRRIDADACQKRLRIDIHFAQQTGDFDQHADALQRRVFVALPGRAEPMPPRPLCAPRSVRSIVHGPRSSDQFRKPTRVHFVQKCQDRPSRPSHSFRALCSTGAKARTKGKVDVLHRQLDPAGEHGAADHHGGALRAGVAAGRRRHSPHLGRAGPGGGRLLQRRRHHAARPRARPRHRPGLGRISTSTTTCSAG